MTIPSNGTTKIKPVKRGINLLCMSQSEDNEGETPLSLAAVHQGLREAMVALARSRASAS